MTYFRTNTKKYLFENVLISISSLFLFCPSVLAIQKTYRKNASDFFLWRQELQASLEVSSKNFANDGLYWNQFWNLWCAMTKHNFLFLSKFCSFEIHLQTHTSLFVGLHNLFGSDMFICNLDFVFSWCSQIFFYFLVSVVVGIVYKDLHDVLITDQPFRTIRWGYLIQFLNQIPLPWKIHKKRNLRGWAYKVVYFSKPYWKIISHVDQWSFPCLIN